MDFLVFIFVLFFAWSLLMGIGMAFAAVGYTVWVMFRSWLKMRYVLRGRLW